MKSATLSCVPLTGQSIDRGCNGCNGSRACFTVSISSTPSFALGVCIPDGHLLDRSFHASWRRGAGALCDPRDLDCPLVRQKGDRALDRHRLVRNRPRRAAIWIGHDRTDRHGCREPPPAIMCHMDGDCIGAFQKSARRRPEDARDVLPCIAQIDETHVAKEPPLVNSLGLLTPIMHRAL